MTWLSSQNSKTSTVVAVKRKIIVEKVRPNGSRLAHLYGLPKLHKSGVPLRPVLSAVGTYNYELAKWLEKLLKPLVNEKYTVNSAFEFVDKVVKLRRSRYMVSFDVVSLFTNVPLHETIEIVLDKLFSPDSESHVLSDQNINVTREQMKKLLEFSVADQLFTFNEKLYVQIDGVSMGSPLGPFFANVFLGHLEDQFFETKKEFLPEFYCRYVDDTFLLFFEDSHVESFRSFVNSFHPAIVFTCERSEDDCIPFIGVTVRAVGDSYETSVYHKECDKGVFVHSQSFCDEKYKRNLLPMLCHRAFALSSTWAGFHEEIERCVACLTKLGYDEKALGAQIRRFLERKLAMKEEKRPEKEEKFRLVLPFKGVQPKEKLTGMINQICRQVDISPPDLVLTSTKLISLLKRPESKPDIVNSGKVTYQFDCPVAGCESRYIGVTGRHLFQRVKEHLSRNSAIRDHLLFHGMMPSLEEAMNCFKILEKSSSRRYLLFTEASYIKSRNSDLNKQSDSIVLNVF